MSARELFTEEQLDYLEELLNIGAGNATTRPCAVIDASTTPSGSTARPRAPPSFSAKTSMRNPAGTVISCAPATPTLSNTSTAVIHHVVMGVP